ncbi:MAG: DUF2490 domain-containing protein [Polyangiaceae bacterium]
MLASRTWRGIKLAIGALVAAPLFLHSAPALADTAVDMQVWGAAFFTAKLTGREPGATGLSAWLDLHARRGGAGVVSIIRPALGYRFTGWFSAWAGYGSIGVFDDNPDTRAQEHRVFEQALFDGSLGPITLQLRPRLEQRFRDGQSDIAHRLRLFGRANVGFGASPVLLATWNETFIALNDAAWGPRTGFDQNRLFLGIGVKGPPGFRVETGYLNVTSRRPVGLGIAHNIAVNLFASF